MPKVISVRTRIVLIICMLTSVSVQVGCGASTSIISRRTPTVPPIRSTVSITFGDRTQFIPSYFTGFSIEPRSVCRFLQLEQNNPALDQFFKNLSPTVIRFGGGSADSSVWQPGATCAGLTFGVSTITDVFAFARRVNARVIWGLNLKSNDSNSAADEAYVVSVVGGEHVMGLEMGNEPNIWTSEPLYEQTWLSYASAITARGITPPFVGPSIYDDGQYSWLGRFVQDARGQLSLVTYHFYPLKKSAVAGNPQKPTLSNLLSASLMADTAAAIRGAVKVAHENGLALDIDETNSVNGGGATGVSDTFASALWMADYLFTAAEQGALMVNVHGSGGVVGGSPYSPIITDPTTHSLTARPVYYGMLLFHIASGNGRSSPLHTTVNSSANLAAHAVLDSDGTLRVVLVNKDLEAATRVQVNLPSGGIIYRFGQDIRLLAPAATATAGVTLGGASVRADGSWSAIQQEPVNVNNGSFTVVLPKASAALVTLSPQR